MTNENTSYTPSAEDILMFGQLVEDHEAYTSRGERRVNFDHSAIMTVSEAKADVAAYHDLILQRIIRHRRDMF